MNDENNQPAEISIGKQGEQNEQDLQEQAPRVSGEQSPNRADGQGNRKAAHRSSANSAPQQAQDERGQIASAEQDGSEVYVRRGSADAGNTGLGAHSTLERQDSTSGNADVAGEHSPHEDSALDHGSQDRR